MRMRGESSARQKHGTAALGLLTLFFNPLVIILLVASVISIILGNKPDAVIILVLALLGVSINFDLAPKMWDLIRNVKGGAALFHMPGTPIKCPGAPQKIMYLAADHLRGGASCGK